MGEALPATEAAAPLLPAELAGPITAPERIVSLDVLRGFAVLGILVMNIQSFAMIGMAYVNPTLYGDLTGANYWVWYFSHLLADMKFMTIFSMLFGAGIIVMAGRCEATGRPSVGLHYRRMLWLLLFGLLHAHLLWYGDILYTYALCGMVAYWFRKAPPWLLLVLGLIAMSVSTGVSLLSGLTIDQWLTEEFVNSWNPPPEMINAEVATYQGGWWEQMGHRIPMAVMFETMLLLTSLGWRAGGLMLVGMALFKLGVFSARRSARFYLALAAVAAVIGAPVIIHGIHRHFEANWDIKYSFFLGIQFNYWASILMSLGWVGLVMLACKTAAAGAITRPLAAVGRMALTNYLMQTIICTTIFYGHGFAQFGEFSRVEQLLTVLGVFALQLIVSPIWLRFFRFGPFEWLW
ncbi:MAG: DUF418 domain-containing protein, partial [Planctomycetota bacterium]